jgi:DeoR family transcriptional regulator, fructose operon transcriptional repressor
LIGTRAETGLRLLHADDGLLGADAIDLDRGVTNANLEEAAVKRLTIVSCRRSTLLADHTTFDRVSLATVCPLTTVDEIVSDGGLDRETRDRYRRAGARLTVAGEEDA